MQDAQQWGLYQMCTDLDERGENGAVTANLATMVARTQTRFSCGAALFGAVGQIIMHSSQWHCDGRKKLVL